jgi:hypothetical protein
MAKALQPAVTADGIFFELERFALGDGPRLELSGRWFGVRGRRFVRPTLTLDVDGERFRALADLEHKPWAAEDGEAWEAAFPLRETSELLEAELSVAPDITVQLPAPSAKLKRSQRLPALPRRDSMQASWRESHSEPAETVAPVAEPLRPDLASSLAAMTQERDRLGEELEQARGELESARNDLEVRNGELTSAREELAAAIAQREAAKSKAEEAIAARDTAATGTDALAAERDHAGQERDQAVAERDELLAERGDAVAARKQNAETLRRLSSELEAARAGLERATRERDQAVAAHGAALVMRDATRVFPAYRRHAGWFRRALAMLVVLGAVSALLIVLHVL